MANLNKVFLMGNLTRDPELRYTPSGTAVCEFGVAINRRWTTPEGERRDETCFVDCNMWARRGEVIAEYFRKGSPIFIEGRLQFDQWETRDGQKRSKLRVVAENFEFLGERGGREGGGPPPSGGQRQPQRQAPPQREPSDRGEAPQGPAPEEPGAGFDVKDDEIPF